MSAECAHLSSDFNYYNVFNVLDKPFPVKEYCKFKKDYWINIKVGDIVRINNNNEIPADISLPLISNASGAWYVATKTLDGGANSKVRQLLKCTRSIKSSRNIARAKILIESEGLYANLYSYQANFR